MTQPQSLPPPTVCVVQGAELWDEAMGKHIGCFHLLFGFTWFLYILEMLLSVFFTRAVAMEGDTFEYVVTLQTNHFNIAMLSNQRVGGPFLNIGCSWIVSNFFSDVTEAFY